MARYAAHTDVSSGKSLEEIRRILTRYGAEGFAFGEDRQGAALQFGMRGRILRFVIPLPDRSDRAITRTPTGLPRAKAQQDAEYEQRVRQRWRALVLIVKAKLEAVESGCVDFETEFLPYMQLPSGETVGEWLSPQIEDVYERHEMPTSLLPGVRLTARALPSGEMHEQGGDRLPQEG